MVQNSQHEAQAARSELSGEAVSGQDRPCEGQEWWGLAAWNLATVDHLLEHLDHRLAERVVVHP